MKIHYSSFRNISFSGVDDFPVPEEWDDMDEEERLKFLNEEEESWLWENVEVWAEVVDG